MIRDEMLEAFGNGTWSLECPHVLLRSNRSTNSVEGYGRLTNATAGTMRLWMCARGQSDASHDGEARAYPELPGRVSLEAEDVFGRKWAAEGILTRGCCRYGDSAYWTMEADIDELQTPPPAVVSGEECSAASPLPTGMAFYFFRKLNFPANSRVTTQTEIGDRRVSRRSEPKVAVFQACGYDFRLRSDRGYTVFSAVAPTSSLPPNFDLRAVEALQFVLARRCDWSILTMAAGGEERVRVRPLPQWQSRPDPWVLPAPVDILDPNAEHVWSLFGAYLGHIRDLPGDSWHPLSRHVRSVLQATYDRCQPGDVLLPLVVAIEGILNSAFPADLRPEPRFHRAVRDACDLIRCAGAKAESAALAEHGGNVCRALERLVAGRTRDLSAREKLTRLASLGAITNDDVDAWCLCRNPLAHGDWSARAGKGRPELGGGHLFMLLYRLIFSAIQYRGKCSDWSGPHKVPLVDFVPPDFGAGLRVEGMHE